MVRPQSIMADAELIPPKVLTVKESIVFYAQQYKVSEKKMLAVAFCESSFNPKAVGDGGRARNIYQYHLPTFIAFEKQLGEDLDYNSYHDQAKLTAFAFSKGYDSHWTCKG